LESTGTSVRGVVKVLKHICHGYLKSLAASAASELPEHLLMQFLARFLYKEYTGGKVGEL
jgi:hypothetical protein